MRLLVLPVVLLMACHASPPARPVPPPLAVTVFLAEDDELPEVATALNERVRGTYPP